MSLFVGIAYYEKKDWDFFLSVIDDRDSVEDSWEEWSNGFMKTKMDLISRGLQVSEVKVNMNELINFCLDRKIKNNGAVRSQFVSEKLKQANP